jgi:cytochrome b561
VIAALWHHFIRKDSILWRMLPSPAAADNRRKTVSNRK